MSGHSFFIKKSSKESIEPQEIFLDSLAQKKEEEIGISEKKIEVPLSKRVLQGLYLFFFILILFLFAKTFQLQVVESKDLSLLAEQNKFAVYSIKAERGVIYDRDFVQLVFNQPSFNLVCHKTKFPQDEKEQTKIIKEISYILGKEFREIKDKIEKEEDSTILISEDLGHQALVLLEARIKEFPGFEIEDKTIRNYKDGKYFSHLIGYTSKIKSEELKAEPEFYSIFDYVGRNGLERTYEEILRKNPGQLRVEKDAKGNIISKEIVFLPESGKSLVLWLDSDLQKKLTLALENSIQISGAKAGVAVALNPKTGGVLSLVSWPSFENNLFSQGMSEEEWQKLNQDPRDPFFNRAISGGYPTGSIIKPLVALAALEEKLINPQKKINCQGLITIPHQYEPEKKTEKKDWTTHGLTDLRKAIAESCNVYFYTIGGGYEEQEGLGPTKIKKYLKLFGWETQTGIDLPGEIAGFIPDKEWKKRSWEENWWDGDTYNLSIGQGYLKITPLEVAVSFSTIVNNGKIFQPQVVKAIIDSEKKLIKEIEPKVIQELNVDSKNLQIIKEGMRQAVTAENSPRASAVFLNSLSVSAAAKTGTAEVVKKVGKFYKKFYHSWVTAFAPYEDPEIVLTIMIEEIPEKELEERLIVLPVAKEVLGWYFKENPK